MLSILKYFGGVSRLRMSVGVLRKQTLEPDHDFFAFKRNLQHEGCDENKLKLQNGGTSLQKIMEKVMFLPPIVVPCPTR